MKKGVLGTGMMTASGKAMMAALAVIMIRTMKCLIMDTTIGTPIKRDKGQDLHPSKITNNCTRANPDPHQQERRPPRKSCHLVLLFQPWFIRFYCNAKGEEGEVSGRISKTVSRLPARVQRRTSKKVLTAQFPAQSATRQGLLLLRDQQSTSVPAHVPGTK